MYSITYIGAGPATMMSVLTLIDNGYDGSICIIERGRSLHTRSKKEVVSGVFGAGAFSDFKVTSALDVGGEIPNLTQEELDIFGDKFLNILNKFNTTGDLLKWDKEKTFNTKSTSLTWNNHKTCHVGTDRGQIICSNIEDYIRKQSNITFLTEEEVQDILYVNNRFIIITDVREIESLRAVLATGQKSMLPTKCIKKFKLNTSNRALQLGIRVEDEMNDQYRKVIKANYDFKFVKNYNINGKKLRLRTFCCNSGNAHTCAEKVPEGFISFNGHAYKTPDPANNKINYGVICESLDLGYDEKEDQISLAKSVNNYNTWHEDNFTAEESISPKRYLLTDLTPLEETYPEECVEALKDFIEELNKLINLQNARYLYPEIKLSGAIPELNFDTFETLLPNLYLMGDASITRGILKSSLTGYKVALNILQK